jgi:nucleotide-binding universal stress UspA family protein
MAAAMTDVTGRQLDQRFAIRRILAAFGPGTLTAPALGGAVDLAARLGAELETLFVEDTALLGLAELPFVRQLGLPALPEGCPARGDLELQLRALATEGQKRLAALAAPQRLRWSFARTRGPMAETIARAAERADLVLLGSGSRPIAREARLDPSVRALLIRATRPVLLLRPEQPPCGPVHVLLEPADEARRLLDVALAVAARYTAGAEVSAWGMEHDLVERLQGQLAEDTGRMHQVRLRALRRAAPGGLEELMAAGAEGILVVSATSGLLGLETWWRAVAGARCTLLLAR